MKLYLTILSLAVMACCCCSCNNESKSTATKQSITAPDTSNITVTGHLFSDYGPMYQYTWHRQSGKHTVSLYDPIRKEYKLEFQFITKTESPEARIIDCNFDGIRDLLIKVETGDKSKDQNSLILLNTRDGWLEVPQLVNYAQFDAAERVVESRYKSSADKITIDKYRWQADSLLLIASETMPESRYNTAFGPLAAISWQPGIY